MALYEARAKHFRDNGIGAARILYAVGVDENGPGQTVSELRRRLRLSAGREDR